MIDEKLKPKFREDLREYMRKAKALKAELEQMERNTIINQRIGECDGKIKLAMLLAERNGFIEKEGKDENNDK